MRRLHHRPVFILHAVANVALSDVSVIKSAAAYYYSVIVFLMCLFVAWAIVRNENAGLFFDLGALNTR